MARTRRQRRWADASTGSQLRFIALELAFTLLFVDIVLDGTLPVWVALTAALAYASSGFYIFLEGCLKALSVAWDFISG